MSTAPIKLTKQGSVDSVIAAFKARKLQFQTKQGRDSSICQYRSGSKNQRACAIGACISDTDWKEHIKKKQIDHESVNHMSISELITHGVVSIRGDKDFYIMLQSLHDEITQMRCITNDEADKKFAGGFNALARSHKLKGRL